MEQNIPILGQLNLSRSPHQHLESAARPEVGLEDGLEAHCGGDVHGASGGLGDDLGVGVEVFETGGHVTGGGGGLDGGAPASR